MEPVINKQTPDSYNAESGEKVSWQEAMEKGYIEGGDSDESIKNNSNAGSK
ncbi:MAG: hypothetical protein ACRC3H_02720 [Lachnospiraceae bacterium]